MLYRFGAYTLDADHCELRQGADRVELEPQVFSVLTYLVQERSRIVTRQDLVAAVWNGRSVSDSTINCVSACNFDPLSRGIGVQN